MDRYVIREPRVGADYPQGNQMMHFPVNVGRNNMLPQENVYYPPSGPYALQFTNMQNAPNASYPSDVNAMNSPAFGQINMGPGQTQMVTGIDPRYLANYSDNRAQYIVTGQQMQVEPTTTPLDTGLGANYLNSNFGGADRNKVKTFVPQVLTHINRGPHSEPPKSKTSFGGTTKNTFQNQHNSQTREEQNTITATTKKSTDGNEVIKKEPQNTSVSKMDRLKALQKSGPRAFSGPVEKVLKWHKALQDIGVFVFYEIIAKCVSVRPGESCAKNLVIRDDNGPAMQVVYYEIDFMLPELKVPSTVRVIGRMIAGTCRLQAFSVRPATGDDVATLQRRAAVAAHHVARLCKENGVSQ
ncbi:uncharacterized protein LOC118269017 isoform X2 [Spodoptera frugiperda]|uniref:Uncharacterized protein LOC118269017 isoform X2 n=1 Tax=Spodoptera frugiperda TaxID=7108 RepID=A0A9R0EJZ5_SPOFR|nr:uncharacterized protein LOC118269017 isoform X2 [Spodoptera frugiperda]